MLVWFFLLFSAMVEPGYSQSVWDRIAGEPNLQSFEDLLSSLSLSSQLASGDQTWTVFAPENGAFNSIVKALWNQDIHLISGKAARFVILHFNQALSTLQIILSSLQ